MTTQPFHFRARTTALLPIAMSSLALLLILTHVAMHGVVHGADEGTPAHLWQLLMAGQLPITAYFVATSLSRPAKSWVPWLALNVTIFAASCTAVFLLT